MPATWSHITRRSIPGHCTIIIWTGKRRTFSAVRAKAADMANRQSPDQERSLRKLDARQRKVVQLFAAEPTVTTKQIADLLGIHRRTAINLCNGWLAAGFLIKFGEARKSRRYELGWE